MGGRQTRYVDAAQGPCLAEASWLHARRPIRPQCPGGFLACTSHTHGEAAAEKATSRERRTQDMTPAACVLWTGYPVGALGTALGTAAVRRRQGTTQRAGMGLAAQRRGLGAGRVGRCIYVPVCFRPRDG